MHRVILTALALTLLPVFPAAADGHDSEGFGKLLAADYREEDRGRDQFRHPAETLAFFGLTPDMVIGEYGPGGGWYTRVLAPWIAPAGTYVGINADVERYMANATPERQARAKAFPETFAGRVAEWTGVDAERVYAVEIDEAPDWQGRLDAVLTFRSLHGLAREHLADETIAHFYGLLKPGGIVGVVQHRAREDAPYSYTRGHNGYLKQSEVIAMFESEGFELVKTSEINANSKDAANHDVGVWALPPTLRNGETDRERYIAVGESDRMTLVFRKPA
ncbi:MAG: class I SAM-dependent methyltransferase [Lysobacterales bacterium]